MADIETHKIAYQGAPKVKFFANACVAIYTSEFNLLCDPWLVDVAFDGSWYHFPPLKTKPEDLNDYTHIYISHIHPDHFDQQTLRRLPKKSPVIICRYAQKWLKNQLEKLGFPVIEVEPGHYVGIAAGIRVWMYESFTKNPLVADAQVPNVIDSAIVVENGNWAILNTNDNIPDDTACRQLREQFGKFDLAMLPYSGASEYPSCFQNLTFEEKQLSGGKEDSKIFRCLRKECQNLRA